MKKVTPNKTIIQLLETYVNDYCRIPKSQIVKTTIVHVFDNHYRCNVFTKKDGVSQIEKSYFITVDETGTIVNSIPELEIKT